MEMSLKLPDCQIKLASSEQSYMLLHLHLIRRSKEKNFIIFSDSMSSLEAISGFQLEIDIVHNIIKDYTNLVNTGKQSFYAGYPVMSIFVAMRALTLHQNQLFLCPLQI